MIIRSVVLEEQKRNLEMIATYEKEIENLPKGNLVIKRIGSHEYYYLRYRNDKKVVTDYVGKDIDKITMIEGQIKKRKHYEDMLSALIKEQKTIAKILEVLE